MKRTIKQIYLENNPCLSVCVIRYTMEQRIMIQFATGILNYSCRNDTKIKEENKIKGERRDNKPAAPIPDPAPVTIAVLCAS